MRGRRKGTSRARRVVAAATQCRVVPTESPLLVMDAALPPAPKAWSDGLPIVVFDQTAARPHVGRVVVAEQPLAAGEPLAASLPFTITPMSEHLKRCCAGCFRLSSGRLPRQCSACRQVFYCSEECRLAHWAGEPTPNGDGELSGCILPHHLACPCLAAFNSAKVHPQLSSLLRMTVELHGRRYLEATAGGGAGGVSAGEPPVPSAEIVAAPKGGKGTKGCANELQVSDGPGAAGADELTDSVAEALEQLQLQAAQAQAKRAAAQAALSEPHRPRDADFEILQHHPAAWDDAERHLWAKPFALLQTALARAPWLAAAEEGSEEVPKPIPVEQLMAEISRIESNCFGAFDGRDRLVGHACYPGIISMFNHSCEPNCRALEGAKGEGETEEAAAAAAAAAAGGDLRLQMVITAKREIASGEECTISYIEADAPRRVRQERLLSNYHFLCACPRCVREEADPKSYVQKGWKGQRKGGAPKPKAARGVSSNGKNTGKQGAGGKHTKQKRGGK